MRVAVIGLIIILQGITKHNDGLQPIDVDITTRPEFQRSSTEV